MSNSVFDLINSAFKKRGSQMVSDPALVNAYNETRNKPNHKTFCHAPSVNMYFTQDGKVKVCCNNFHYVVGSYPQQNIREIWNSVEAHELRNKMKRYDLSSGCGVCEADFRSRNFGEVRARHFDTLPVNTGYPTMMEFLLTNTCNLECVMCRGENSSLIRKNREKLPPIISPYDKEFLKQLGEFIPYLHETRFSGSGEAFSIDMYYEIWEMILAKNPDCLIMVQTNGTILTARVKEMLSKGNFEIGVSIDSLKKETYESIRLNARFEKVMDNIRYFEEYSRRKNKRFNIGACVMRQNWRELPEFINFCNEMNATIQFHKVWWPREYALFNLPATELNEIYTHLSSFDFPADSPIQKLNRQHYHYFVSVIKDWMERAPLLEAESAQVNMLPNEELLPFIEEKLKRSIESGSEPEEEKSITLLTCLNKLEAVTALTNATYKEEDILKWICTLPAHELVDGLKMQSPKFIFEEAKKQLS